MKGDTEMSIIDSVMNALRNNHFLINRKERQEMINTIGIHVSDVGNNVDPSFDSRIMKQYAALCSLESRNKREEELSRECIKLHDIINSNKLTKEQEEEAKKQFVQKCKEMKDARARYDKSLEVIKDCKSPYYTKELNASSEKEIYSRIKW